MRMERPRRKGTSGGGAEAVPDAVEEDLDKKRDH